MSMLWLLRCASNYVHALLINNSCDIDSVQRQDKVLPFNGKLNLNQFPRGTRGIDSRHVWGKMLNALSAHVSNKSASIKPAVVCNKPVLGAGVRLAQTQGSVTKH